CGRLPWQAEQAPALRVYRIGYLTPGPGEMTSPPSPGAASPSGWSSPSTPRSYTGLPQFEAFRQGLAEHGYVEGQNLAIEYRTTAQGAERLRELAIELVRLPVDIIVATAFAALAAKQATQAIPIVFVGGGDPVAGGLVESLRRPGGNVTGLPVQI